MTVTTAYRTDYRYLPRIGSPKDLKRIPESELPALCAEVRRAIIARCDAVGGHVGSNLGAVEISVALHTVFDSPRDHIVLDVSHQSYTHKILTGRAAAFIDPAHYDDVSGFTDPDESEHDLFAQGHTGTSISLACGLAKARDLIGGPDAWRHERVVAMIGDGSLSSGVAFEGLNEAGELGTGLVIVVNDNNMSIAPDHGGMYAGFEELRRTHGQAERNLFRDLGLEYRYVEEGNDVHALIPALREARDLGRPVVVHIHTTKGLGLDWAMRHREAGHWQDGAAEVPEGAVLPKAAPDARRQYGMAAMDLLLERIRRDEPVMVVSPATPGSNGITPAFRTAAGDHFIDVGITEQHALAFAAGLARRGARPVVGTSATFLQRAYDQFHQELGLNRSPVTVLMFQTGLSGTDMTHQGMFDIPMLSAIPGLICLAPASMEEFLAMVDWAVGEERDAPEGDLGTPDAMSVITPNATATDHSADGDERRFAEPVVIQVPSRVLHESDYASRTDPTPQTDPMSRTDRTGHGDHTSPSACHAPDFLRYRTIRHGSRVAIIALGDALPLALDTADRLRATTGIEASVIDPRIFSSLDTTTLDGLCDGHKLVVTLENGSTVGGFGERIAAHYGPTTMRTLVRGGAKTITDRVPLDEQLRRYRLTPELLADDIARMI